MNRIDQYVNMVQTGWLTVAIADGIGIWDGTPAAAGVMIINDAIKEFSNIPEGYDLYTAAVLFLRNYVNQPASWPIDYARGL